MPEDLNADIVEALASAEADATGAIGVDVLAAWLMVYGLVTVLTLPRL